MKIHPENFDIQIACHNMLTATAAWNGHTSKILGADGSMAVIMNFYKRFMDLRPLDVIAVVGSVGFHMDFNEENRVRFRELGFIHQLFQWKKKHYSGHLCAICRTWSPRKVFQKIWSCLCLSDISRQQYKQ